MPTIEQIRAATTDNWLPDGLELGSPAAIAYEAEHKIGFEPEHYDAIHLALSALSELELRLPRMSRHFDYGRIYREIQHRHEREGYAFLPVPQRLPDKDRHTLYTDARDAIHSMLPYLDELAVQLLLTDLEVAWTLDETTNGIGIGPNIPNPATLPPEWSERRR